ncbi:MAG TPA: class II aldolase/adducin family protein [Bryobacteraceae bacterium]|nr:class II aldolase/adducin family protein [Bryobacteraceae bacterium]
MKSIDLTKEKVITLADLSAAAQEDTTELRVSQTAVVTPSALEFTDQRRISIRRGAEGTGARAEGKPAAATGAGAVQDLFNSPEAEAVKEEICAVGRKLWLRQYVDGNGGNISYRIGPNAFLCTPTLLSKYDLRPQDIGMVDIEGKQIAGARARTSEILMHLEIFKEVPEAKGIVHCHPAHATAYAITGRVPPTCVIPEYEVFIGKVGLTSYETPGTPDFARTVIPFAKNHNAILLGNHGIVCWADTVTHAEWYAEVLDTYCWTLMLAAQLGTPVSHFGPDKAADLLAIKKRLGLPDPRNEFKECELCDMPEDPASIALPPRPCGTSPALDNASIEAIVQAVTDRVVAALNAKK